jgi:serine/threonine-protein kinase HipA
MARIKALNIAVPQGASGTLLKNSQFAFLRADEQARHDVSLVMPAAHSPFVSNVLHPIFDMNVPEGYLADQIKRRMAKHIQVDEMRLLSLIGGNQIGRVDYHEPDTEKNPRSAHLGLKDILQREQSAEVFEFLVESYFDSGISGVQPKVLVPDRDKARSGRATLLASDLIVKSGVDQYPGLAQNEFLCLDAARRAGLDTPPFWLSDNGELFVMERFDLAGGRRLGFEDIAVLLRLDKDPHDNYKYSQSYETVAKVINQLCSHARPGEALASFYTSFCLSVMVRNGDAHLKNYGLLYDHPGDRSSVRLSPAYDITTTSVYSHYSARMGREVADRSLALKLNKRKAYPERDELLAFGSQHCLVRQPEKVIERVAQAMLESLAEHKPRIEPELFMAMSKEWEAGIAMATHPGVKSPMRRRPVKPTLW